MLAGFSVGGVFAAKFVELISKSVFFGALLAFARFYVRQRGARNATIARFKRNLLLRDFILPAGCSAQTMCRAVLDFMVFGEGYFQRHTNRVDYGRVGQLTIAWPNGAEVKVLENPSGHIVDTFAGLAGKSEPKA